jgi:hypothetical protein
MPVSSGRVRLKNRRSACNMNQHHHRSRNRNGRSGVHHNAEGTMVSGCLYRVNVRHLHHGQERQQKETHNADNRQSAKLCAAFPAHVCAKSSQYTDPYSKNTHSWMLSLRKRLRS